MEKENIEITMAESTKALFLMGKLKEVPKHTIFIFYTKESGKKESLKEQENLFGRKIRNLRQST